MVFWLGNGEGGLRENSVIGLATIFFLIGKNIDRKKVGKGETRTFLVVKILVFRRKMVFDKAVVLERCEEDI